MTPQKYEPMHHIVFLDGTSMTITETQSNALLSQSGDTTISGIMIGKQYIRFNAIAKILNEHEFARQYPDKASHKTDYPHFKSVTPEDKKAREKNRAEGQASLLKGLQGFIDRTKALGQPTSNAERLLESMQQIAQRKDGNQYRLSEPTLISEIPF